MNNSKQILAVINDSILSEMLLEQFQYWDNFSINISLTKTEVLETKRPLKQDAIVIELMASEGTKNLEKIHKYFGELPIIFLLESNVDANNFSKIAFQFSDYLKKPFRFSDLIKKLKEQMRLYERTKTSVFEIGPFIFQPDKKLLIKKQKQIHLTDKENSILAYLYNADMQAINREALLGAIWGYNAAVTTHTLETHIYRLRQKIEEDPSNSKILVTNPKGYKLVP